MADGQYYPYADGSMKVAPNWKAPSSANQETIIEDALAGSSKLGYTWINKSSAVKSVSLTNIDGTTTTVHLSMRSVSGGGRPSSQPEELRVQISPEQLNQLYEINLRGGVGLIVGIFCNEDAKALVLWRPLDGSSGSGSVSKQIDGEVIAKALINGVSSCIYPDGEIVYAMVPMMLRAYIDCFMPNAKQASVSALSARELNCAHNLIFFGAPGTGKSYQLNLRAIGNEDVAGLFPKRNVRRVTFHPDYTYAQFVGCFKPYVEPEIDEESPVSAIKYSSGGIEYRFVPGPFIETYVDAIKHPEQNYLLIIEELNRANPAAVFGDVFQLLDRKEDGFSEYSVATSEDLNWYLFKQWKSILNVAKPQERKDILYSLDDPEAKELASSMTLPSNMYIWATMNSADQGVFPMDTAFKRRWDFEYLSINDKASVAVISGYSVPLSVKGERVNWDRLRRSINDLLREAKVNEDKWLGPFFIKPEILADGESFRHAFKDKVLLYLYEDAVKTRRGKVFVDETKTYSELCHDFDDSGIEIFIGMDDLGITPADVEDEVLVEE